MSDAGVRLIPIGAAPDDAAPDGGGEHVFDAVQPRQVISDADVDFDPTYEGVASATAAPTSFTHAPFREQARAAADTGDVEALRQLRAPYMPPVSDAEMRELLQHELRTSERRDEIRQTAFYQFIAMMAQRSNRLTSQIIRPPTTRGRGGGGGGQCALPQRTTTAPPRAAPVGMGRVGGFEESPLTSASAGAPAPTNERAVRLRAARAWLQQPHVIGMMDIAPEFRAAITFAYHQLLQHCPNLAHAPIEALWESEHARAVFADYAAMQVLNAAVLAPTSPHLQREKPRIDQREMALLFELREYFRWSRGVVRDIRRRDPPLRAAPGTAPSVGSALSYDQPGADAAWMLGTFA